MRFGLATDDIEHINAVFASVEGVEKVIIFGSRALGTYKQGSDIDLALVGKSLTFDKLMKVYSSLEDLGLLYKFDIQVLDKIKDPDVLAHINRVGKLFYKAS